MRKTIFVGMSGGVDSSVAAALLKYTRLLPAGRHGVDVVGIHLKCWNVDGCAEEDAEDARRAAEVIGIPFYVLDFEKEYKEKVVGYMVEGYRQGITPNPDVMCNREIKFGLFLRKALSMGADYVAMGHYVRRRYSPSGNGGAPAPAAGAHLRSRRGDPASSGNRARRASESFLQANTGSYQLLQAKDLNKDQSYFLWTLTQDELKHCLFPIGEYTKPEVRALARKFGLPNAEKKDSQGICFLGKVTLADFLKQYLPERQGIIVTMDGRSVGRHPGAWYYTIGQRHFGISNIKNQISKITGDRKPLYVAEKNVKTNTLVLAERDDPALYRKEIELCDVNLISTQLRHAKKLENVGISVYARVRYRQPFARANLKLKTDSPKQAQLMFDKSQRAVAPGQSAVFYAKSGEMLGGGVII